MATPEVLTCIFHEQDPIIAPRRSSDNLPTHVKGIARWYPDAEPQAGYYVPKKYSPSGDFEPLEFINNQWFGIFGHSETSTTHLCTRASAAIPIVNRLGIGYWDITDPQHPDFEPNTTEPINVDPLKTSPVSPQLLTQTHHSPTPLHHRCITIVQLLDLPSHQPVPSPFLPHRARPLSLLNPFLLNQPCQLAPLEDEAEVEVEVEECQQPLQLHPTEACEAYHLQSSMEPVP